MLPQRRKEEVGLLLRVMVHELAEVVCAVAPGGGAGPRRDQRREGALLGEVGRAGLLDDDLELGDDF